MKHLNVNAKLNAKSAAVIVVAALGYFVDIYDLLLFSIVRVESLSDLGLKGQELTDQGLLLINSQMAGMLIGGVVFGVWGDKRGRLKILFGSILLYSIANLLNGWVNSVETYAVLRFIAGIGLAGELGAGISLVTEILPKEIRGLGTMIVASVGVSGAALAWWISEIFSWREAYWIGGGMGLLLLLFRLGVVESGMFQKMNHSAVSRGNFLSLFTSWSRFKRYATCILIGIQFWFMVGILITLSPEFAHVLGIDEPIEAGRSVLWCYLGLTCGDMLSGFTSHLFKSRKKALLLFMLLSSASICVYLFGGLTSSLQFYVLCFAMGVASGYWAIFVTVAAENFGTNLRATVATTVPNFVRGSLVPISALFAYLKPSLGLIGSATVVGTLCIAVSFWGLSQLQETFHKDLDYLED